MAFVDKSKANYAFKALLGKAHTSNNREFANETILSGVTVQASRVWAEPIPKLASSLPSTVGVQVTGVQLEAVVGAVIDGIQVAYRMKLGGSVPAVLVGKINPLTGVAYAPNDYVGNVIPDSYGVEGASDYRPILYNNGVEVPPTDISDWFLDPFSGVVVREKDVDSTTGWSGPMTIDAYIYVGKYVSDMSDENSTDISDLTAAVQNITANIDVTSVDGTIDVVYTTPYQWDLSVADYISKTEVASVSAGLNTSINDVASDLATLDAGLDARFVNVSGDTMTGDLNVPNLVVTNNATINGNLYVNGTEFIVDTETVSASDNIILINGGDPGPGVTAGYAGVRVDRGSADDYFFVFDELRDGFVVGVAVDETSGALSLTQMVATREDDPLVNGYARWNDSLNRFDTVSASTLAADISSSLDLTGDTTIVEGTGINVSQNVDEWTISVDDYISKTEVASVSGNLQGQITTNANDITALEADVTVLSGAIDSINVVAGTGVSVLESPTNTFTVSVSDYISKTEVASVSGNLQGQIDSIVSTSYITVSGLDALNAYEFNGTNYVKANATAISSAGVIGVAESSTKLVISGVLEVSGTPFTVGADYWLGLVDGQIVTPEPTYVEGNARLYIGTAIAANKLLVNIDIGTEVGPISAAESYDVSAFLQSQITSNDVDIAALSAAIDAVVDTTVLVAGTGISVVEAPADTWTVTVTGDYALNTTLASISGNLQGQITTNANDITALEADVTVLSGAIDDVASDLATLDAGLDARFVNVSGDTMTGDLTVPNLVVTNNATINGNLYVNGTEFIVDTETVSASDNIILINGGDPGPGVTAGYAGVRVDRGSADDYFFVFDELRDGFVVGVAVDETSGALSLTQMVATREDDPLVNGYARWNDSLNRFDTVSASTLAADISSSLDLSGDTELVAGTGISVVENTPDNWTISVVDYISKTEVASISGNLQGQITTNANDITALEADVTVLSGAIDDVASDVTVLSGAIDGLAGDVTVLSGAIDGLAGDVTVLSGAIDGLAGDVTVLSGAIDDLVSDVAALSASLGITLQGSVACVTSTNVYTINHSEISSISTTFPQISLAIPLSGSALYVQGITDRTTTSFKVILSGIPDVAGYSIYWLLNDGNNASGYVGREYAVGTFNSGTSFTPNAKDYETFDVTLTGNATIQLPSNMLNGQKIVMKINGNGTNTLTFVAGYRFSNSTAPTSPVASNESVIVTITKIADKYYASFIEDYSEV